jgi:hypothetical protein
VRPIPSAKPAAKAKRGRRPILTLSGPKPAAKPAKRTKAKPKASAKARAKRKAKGKRR